MDGDPTHQELTPQEHQVLDLLAEGADGGTIAAKLGLSRNMVRTDVQSIMQKLEVHSRLEAVVHHLRSDQAPASVPIFAGSRRVTAKHSFAGSLPQKRIVTTSLPRHSRDARAALISPST
jgi:DNA-binding CsgD family transcriptional regulator